MPKIKTEGDYYTVAQAADILEVSATTVWRWIKADLLPAYRAGPKNIRIKKQDLERVVTPARQTGPREEVNAMSTEQLRIERPTPEGLARRQRLVATILAKREERVITPLTASDPVREAREEQEQKYGPPTTR